MAFNSFGFLLAFLPLTLVGFRVSLRFGPRPAKLWLIGASIGFYASLDPGALPVLIVSVAGNAGLARYLWQAGPDRARRAMAVGVAANLALLGWGKLLAPALPAGLSFFTFTQIGLLLDCAAGATPRRRLEDCVLFAVFFPAMLAGPILSPRDILPQLADATIWRFRASDLAVGGGLFILGLLKKTLLADPLAPIVASGFAAPDTLGLWPAWQTALSWSLQLYFDFSGYSDMAVGLARLFGLRYPANFAQPYRAACVIDYWQRWHISLTRFLMGTVYTPLAMAVMRRRRMAGLPIGRPAQQRPSGFATMLALPITVTMLLAGLWHGIGWTYLAFGLLHAGFLCVNHGWRLLGGPKLPRIGSIVLTQLCVLSGAVLFRAATMTDALHLLGGMTGLHGSGLDGDMPDPAMARDLLWLAALYVVIFLAPDTTQIMTGTGRFRWRPDARWAFAFGGLAALALLSVGGSAEFLYAKF